MAYKVERIFDEQWSDSDEIKEVRQLDSHRIMVITTERVYIVHY